MAKYYSKDEQETVIQFDAGNDKAHVWSSDPKVIRRLKGFECKIIRESNEDIEVELPLSYISFKKPYTMSDKAKKQRKDRVDQFKN